MNFRLKVSTLLISALLSLNVLGDNILIPDTTFQTPVLLDPEQLLKIFAVDSTENKIEKKDTAVVSPRAVHERRINYNKQYREHYDIKKVIAETPIIEMDTLFLENNLFFIDLVYRDEPFNFPWKSKLKPYSYFYEDTYDSIFSSAFKKIEIPEPEKTIKTLRADAYRKNMLTSPVFFSFRADELPSTLDIQSKILIGKSLERVQLVDDSKQPKLNDKKLTLEKVKITHWTRKANSMFQFSQNYVSDNWHQGGNDYISILGIVNGQLNYDNKKNVQWDNNAEWRLGFNSVEDAVRALNTNDDILKANSKLGIRAGGNFFYSSAIDFSAQLFNNYKSATSEDLKASFLTPVRLNIGIGMDYKYKKLFSLMVSPLSYKYIYAHNSKVPSNLFGIPKDENYLSQIGSSFRAQFSYSPSREIQLDSKLSFYTNYEKIEVDWEIVTNFTVNRFLSTRLSINPRYDNTVILPNSQKAKIQFKELLSFGLSYKLVN